MPELPSYGTLELDGLWTRTRRGRTELKAIRAAAAGTALRAFGPWTEMNNRAWQLGSHHPAHSVRDGDGAIAAGVELVYGGKCRISCACFICCGSIGGTLGWRVMRRRGGCWRQAVWRKVGNGRGGTSDDVAFGAAQSGVAAVGEAGDGLDGAQPAGAAARAGAAQPNHLKRNAIEGGGRLDAAPGGC